MEYAQISYILPGRPELGTLLAVTDKVSCVFASRLDRCFTQLFSGDKFQGWRVTSLQGFTFAQHVDVSP